MRRVPGVIAAAGSPALSVMRTGEIAVLARRAIVLPLCVQRINIRHVQALSRSSTRHQPLT
jgi:hypothetical protein